MKQTDVCAFPLLGESLSHCGCSTTLIGSGLFMLSREASKEKFVFKKSELCRESTFKIASWKIKIDNVHTALIPNFC